MPSNRFLNKRRDSPGPGCESGCCSLTARYASQAEQKRVVTNPVSIYATLPSYRSADEARVTNVVDELGPLTTLANGQRDDKTCMSRLKTAIEQTQCRRIITRTTLRGMTRPRTQHDCLDLGHSRDLHWACEASGAASRPSAALGHITIASQGTCGNRSVATRAGTLRLQRILRCSHGYEAVPDTLRS